MVNGNTTKMGSESDVSSPVDWTSEVYIGMVSQRVKRAASQPGNLSQVQSPRFEKHQSIPVHYELEAKQSTS